MASGSAVVSLQNLDISESVHGPLVARAVVGARNDMSDKDEDPFSWWPPMLF